MFSREDRTFNSYCSGQSDLSPNYSKWPNKAKEEQTKQKPKTKQTKNSHPNNKQTNPRKQQKGKKTRIKTHKKKATPAMKKQWQYVCYVFTPSYSDLGLQARSPLWCGLHAHRCDYCIQLLEVADVTILLKQLQDSRAMPRIPRIAHVEVTPLPELISLNLKIKSCSHFNEIFGSVRNSSSEEQNKI